MERVFLDLGFVEFDAEPGACIRAYDAALRIDGESLAHDVLPPGHVTVNGHRVTIPSQQLRKGDVVEIHEKSRQMIVLRHNLDTLDRAVPAWLDVTSADFKATVRDLPLREQIDVPVREQLIVELYSK